MFEDYESLRAMERRTLLVRLISVLVCVVLFQFCNFISVEVSYIALAFFAAWYLFQLFKLRHNSNLEVHRRQSFINFGIDLTFVTIIVINNGIDPYWGAYTIYALECIEGLIALGIKGGIIATTVASIVTFGVSYYRFNDLGIGEPIYATAFRLIIILVVGLVSTFGLSQFWNETRQSARTDALDALNGSLIASDGVTESQLHKRIEIAVRSLMRANSFLLALFPTSTDFEGKNEFEVKPDELLAAIVTLNHRQLSIPNKKLGWKGNYLVRQCLAERTAMQESVIKPTIPDLSPDYLNTLPWYSQYCSLPGIYLYVPIIVDDILLGVMGVRRNSKRIFDLNSVALFEQLATMCGTALNNVRVANNQSRTISELALLNQISLDLAQAHEFDEMVVKLRERLTLFFEASNVRFMLKVVTPDESEQNHNAKVRSLEGIEESGIQTFEQNLLEEMLATKENLLITDLLNFKAISTSSQKILADPESLETAIKGSYIAVPISAESEVLGILSIHSTQKNRYTNTDLQLLETVAYQAATVIQNMRLQRKTLQNLTEVRELYNMLVMKESQLRREVEERARFEGAVLTARAISHEIGQPLTAILGLVTLARAGVALTPKDIDILVQETLHAREIISKLRSVVRFETKPYADQIPMLDLDASSKTEKLDAVFTK